ncbi:MAG: type II 3-dehydroquinate dehydratase [Gemmatimonadaceae bacterium]|nr:type II 3-dehydroquinate dehydratase [Gemmatimonadaceae bacterium]
MRVLLLNGPNLNLLGTREPALYGATTLADVEARCGNVAAELGATLTCAQHNDEGGLVSAVHTARATQDALIVNAGAFGHTSLALRDALAAVALPFIEVHVTNVYAREPMRRHSMLAPLARGVIVGLGTDGYEWALRALARAGR